MNRSLRLVPRNARPLGWMSLLSLLAALALAACSNPAAPDLSMGLETPAEIGSVSTDDAVGTATLNFSPSQGLSNSGSPGNHPPTLVSILLSSPTRERIAISNQRPLLTPGQSIRMKLNATDADGDVLTFAFSIASGGGVLTGADGVGGVDFKASSNAGSVSIALTVSDARGGTCKAILTMYVEQPAPRGPNRNPVITSFDATTRSLAPGASTTLIRSAVDPDGDLLTYTFTILSGPGRLSAVSNVLYYTAPTNFTASKATLRLRVTDAFGGGATHDLGLTLLPY